MNRAVPVRSSGTALLISIFVARATGGTVIAGQYPGQKNRKEAEHAGNQMEKSTVFFPVIVPAVVYTVTPLILNYFSGSISADVHTAANTYLLVMVFHFGVAGVAGAAIPTLISRIGAALSISYFARRKDAVLRIGNFLKEKADLIMYGSFIASSSIILLLMPFIMKIYHLSLDATSMVWTIVLVHAVLMILIWPHCTFICFCFRVSYGNAWNVGSNVCRLDCQIGDLQYSLPYQFMDKKTGSVATEVQMKRFYSILLLLWVSMLSLPAQNRSASHNLIVFFSLYGNQTSSDTDADSSASRTLYKDRLCGNAEVLAAAFAEGAESKGHTVTNIQVGKQKIAGCPGCEYCHNNHSTCIQKDAMQDLYPLLAKADMLVFAPPIYYWNITGQLQNTIARMYACPEMKPAAKKYAILLSSGSPNVYDAAIAQYSELTEFSGGRNMGIKIYPGNAKRKYLDDIKAFGESL